MAGKTERRTIDRGKVIDWAVFAVLLVVVSGITLTLFHKQTLGNPQSYHSDMKAYILEMQGLDSGYNFPYPIFFKLSALIHLAAPAELSVAIATMLLNSLAILITKASFNYLVLEDLKNCFRRKDGEWIPGREWMAGTILSVLAVSLFFISMLYTPGGKFLVGIKAKYLGVFTPNPFHNATYLAARPFAILAFLWFVKLLPVYEKETGKQSRNRKDYIFFSAFLLLATMTKPSFTIVLVGAAGLIMLWRLFRSHFQNLVPTFYLGVCFIPTFIDLLYQYKGVFVPDGGEEGGLGFCLGDIWRGYCNNIPLAVCLAVGFPLLVLLMNYQEWKKNTLFRFSWQVYLMGFAMAFFLYEKGYRKIDFNFSWGYMYGIFFCQLGALVVLLKVTARDLMTEVQKKQYVQLGIQWMVYFLHLICGICYFGVYWVGDMYY